MDSEAPHYKPILPDSTTPQPQSPIIGVSRTRLVPKPRRSVRHIACNPCRKRKVNCDGANPLCSPCVSKGIRDCVYASERNRSAAQIRDLQDQLANLESRLNDRNDVVAHLRSVPEEEALTTLRRLRSTRDPNTVLDSLGGHSLSGTRPSELRTAQALGPPVRSGAEFELMAQWGSAYPRLFFTDVSALMALLDSRMFKGESLQRKSSAREQLSLQPKHEGSEAAGSPSQTPPQRETKSHLRASPSAIDTEHLDDRLRNLDIQYWTKVPLSNELATALISFYLQTDHAIFGFFDADIFLDDLVRYRHDFCSSFLVSALLCLACQEYTAVRPDTGSFRQALFHEAHMLFRSEVSNDCITSLSAIGLFGAACIFEGQDTLGMELSVAGRRMAERLGLVGPSAHDTASQMTLDESPKFVRAASHATWGAYNWLTMHVVFYHQEPIPYGPALPIPGDTQAVASPHSPSKPTLTGKTFRKHCKLWTVAQEIAAVYIMSQESTVPDRVPLAFAEAKFHRLLSVVGRPDGDVPRAVGRLSAEELLFQILLHVIIIVIFRPFIGMPRECRLRSFTFTDSHPKAVHAASVAQLQSMIVYFRSEYPGSVATPFLNTGLFPLSLSLLEDQTDPYWQHYFLLCLRCWKDLYVCYPMFRSVIQAILSVAIQKKAMTSHKAKEFMDTLNIAGRHHLLAGQATTRFSVSVLRADYTESHIDTMAKKFDELIIVDELTTP